MQGLFQFWRSEVEKYLAQFVWYFLLILFLVKKKSYNDYLKGNLEHKL